MAAASVPAGRSVIGRKLSLAPVSRFLSRLARPARPVLANLASVPLHAAGLACVDTGVFTASPVAGWIITGASLIWLEHVIADEK